MDNDPIYADQNFANLAQEGQGSDFNEDQSNGDAGDYEGSELTSPVESEFKDDNVIQQPSRHNEAKGGNEPAGNIKEEGKPAVITTDKNKDNKTPQDKKEPKAIMLPKTSDEKNKKAGQNPKAGSEY